MKIILQIGQKMDFSKIYFIFLLAFTIKLRNNMNKIKISSKNVIPNCSKRSK